MKLMKLIAICQMFPCGFFFICINSINILNNFQYISEGMIHFGVVEDTPTDHQQLQWVLPNPRTQLPTYCGSSYSLGYHNHNYLQVYQCPWSISHKHQNHCLSLASRHLHPHPPYNSDSDSSWQSVTSSRNCIVHCSTQSATPAVCNQSKCQWDRGKEMENSWYCTHCKVIVSVGQTINQIHV